MSSSQKLHILLDLLGGTQDDLAHRLGVSFATLNSWIRKRSQPRKKKEADISALYYQVTGLPPKTFSPLEAKRRIISNKQAAYPPILSTIQRRKDIRDQWCLSLTYNTNRIEGSTLTENQTAAILFDNVALGNKTLVEHMEAKNHQAAFLFLLDWLTKKKPLHENIVLKLHSILLNGIQQDAGTYRQHGVRIVGSYVPTANFHKIPRLMKNLIDDLNHKKEFFILHVADIHSRFEQIHPFSDGNGRIGRLLIQAMLLEANYAPALIAQKKKRKYLTSLNKAQLKGTLTDLEEFICDAILQGYRIFDS